MFIEMHFYTTKTPDGSIHVQNAIMGHFGQHHVHSEEGFKRWVKDTGVSEGLNGGE